MRLINRFLLPGLAFKAVVIGGGYATGRELVEFFFASGPQGGLMGMTLAMLIWSGVCALTFLFAMRIRSLDYQAFFEVLLGRFAFLFELLYFAFLFLVLAVFGAAAGAIGAAMLGVPTIVGTLALMASILIVVSLGEGAVEWLFKYVSVLLYSVYAIFLVFCVMRFGGDIEAALLRPVPTDGWVEAGITYAGYNLIGAVLILPVLRHLTRPRDAIIAGVLCGPLAMAPAIIFFLCLLAFYPAIGAQPLPSDFLLSQLDNRLLHIAFQSMVFAALLESSVGFVHAFNARIDGFNQSRGRVTPPVSRFLVPAVLMTFAIFLAERVGLVALIASGYRIVAVGVILVFIVPLLTLGVARILRDARAQRASPSENMP